jgi:hypothetical protein
LDFELDVVITLADPLELIIGGEWARYFLSFHSRPSDPGVVVQRRIAGGAVDQYLYGVVAIALGF